MALAINTDSPHWDEIKSILFRFAEHAEVCETCNTTTGTNCDIGAFILAELTEFGDAVKNVPEDWNPNLPKPN